MYKNLPVFLILIFFISACSGEKAKFETGKLLFNGGWDFLIDTSGFDAPEKFGTETEALQWEQVSLPHTPRLEPLVVKKQWQGSCWYRKSFSASNDWTDKQLFLRFEGAMNVAEVWVNGKPKIIHYGGYLPFVVEITDDILLEEINTVYVKLNNEDNPVTGPKPLKDLDFNMYGGLYRDVFLLVKNRVHISDAQFADVPAGGGIFVTYPEVSGKRALLSIQSHIQNSENEAVLVEVRQELRRGGERLAVRSEEIRIDPDQSKHVQQEMEVAHPLLWSPAAPNLYELETTLLIKGEILDREITRIGIRKFEFRENKLYVNGEETFLRGINRHQEYPYIGYALSNNAQYRDAFKIKEAGFDYVRLSHYPHSPAFMDACDELGLICIDAILGWQYYREDETFKKHVVQTCRDLIRRDRNHPSVLAWEVSLNESWMPEAFIDSLIAAAREEYPGEHTYTAGWQQYGYDIYLQARQHRLGHPPQFPDKPYIVSEYGDWEYYAMNAGLNQDLWGDLLEEERSSRQGPGSGEKRLLQQALNIQEAHNDNLNTPAVADGYWVMFDYNRGYADDLEESGIMGIFRIPKYSYHFFRSQRSAGELVHWKTNDPMVFIASEYSGDASGDIRVFSNCEEVELWLNDSILGRQWPDQNRISEFLKHPPFTFKEIPFTPGMLSARGIIDGETAAAHSIATAGDPVEIILEADLSGRPWESGVKDGIFVHAKIVDHHKQVIHDFSGSVAFEISGDAALIGNLSPPVEGGIATALIMAGEEPGEVTLKAVSGSLQAAPLVIRTK